VKEKKKDKKSSVLLFMYEMKIHSPLHLNYVTQQCLFHAYMLRAPEFKKAD